MKTTTPFKKLFVSTLFFSVILVLLSSKGNAAHGMYRWQRPVIGYTLTNTGLSYSGPRNQYLSRIVQEQLSKTYLGKGESDEIVGPTAIQSMHEATADRSQLFLLTPGETDRLGETNPTQLKPKLLGFFRMVSDRIKATNTAKPEPTAVEFAVAPHELGRDGLLPGLRDNLNLLVEITHFHLPEAPEFSPKQTQLNHFMTFRELFRALIEKANSAGGFEKLGMVAAVFSKKEDSNSSLLRYWGSWGFKPKKGLEKIQSKDPNVLITVLTLDISDFADAYLRKLEANALTPEDIPTLDVERASLKGW